MLTPPKGEDISATVLLEERLLGATVMGRFDMRLQDVVLHHGVFGAIGAQPRSRRCRAHGGEPAVDEHDKEPTIGARGRAPSCLRRARKVDDATAVHTVGPPSVTSMTRSRPSAHAGERCHAPDERERWRPLL